MNSLLVTDLNVETAKFDKSLKNCISLSEDHSNLQAAQKKENHNQNFQRIFILFYLKFN
jgi:hypothetical protein